MQIAVTGVSGFLGSTIARTLHAAGHSVVGLVRSTSRRDHIEEWVERFVVGDQADESAWPSLLDGADCVIHNSVNWAALKALAANPDALGDHLSSNLNASLRLLAASAPRQFIFISTIAVHHDMRPRWGGCPDEDHPLRPSTAYGAYKASVEAHLWADHFATGRHTSAVRPCGVYGLDPSLDRCYGVNLIRKLRRGVTKLRKPGGGKFVHVDDVAAAVTALVGNPDAAGQAYNLVDGYARWADLAQLAAEVVGVEADIDFSSPDKPKNTFDTSKARGLVPGNPEFLNRGLGGIKDYLTQLAERIESNDAKSTQS